MNYSRRTFLRLGMLAAIAPLGCAIYDAFRSKKQEIFAQSNLPKELAWISTRIGKQGLIDSFDDNLPLAYTFDQALSIIAFTKHDVLDISKELIEGLRHVRNPVGGFHACYNTDKQKVGDRSVLAGNNAYVILALAHFMHASKEEKYMKDIIMTADWLCGLQNNDRESDDYGAVYMRPETNERISTEHNLVAHAALRHVAKIADKKEYHNHAEKIRAWLFREMWARAPTSKGPYHDLPIFWAGKNDFAYVTDVNILPALCLEKHDSSGSLDWIVNHAKVSADFEGKIIEGFSWDAVNKGPVWVKGTEMVVAALHAVGDHTRADYYHDQSRKTQNATGGIPYSTAQKDQFNRQNAAYSVAATAWFYFNEKKCSPFKIE